MVAQDLRSAKMAPIIASYFKMVVPLIVILPGLLAIGVLPFRLFPESAMQPGMHSYDEVLPLMLARYCGPGLLGLGHVMCCNDMAAICALKTLSGRSMTAGRDISLVGFDDLTLCSFTQPSLTTIRFSPSEIATLAFRALHEEIQADKAKREAEYKTRFVLRDSTGPPCR